MTRLAFVFLLLFQISIQTFSFAGYTANRSDFLSFIKGYWTNQEVQWDPNLHPRSYVISIDFTLSEKHGFRVLELNGPPDLYQAHSAFPPQILEVLKYHESALSVIQGHIGSGYSGHELLYPQFPLNKILLYSARDFSKKRGWTLKAVKTIGADHPDSHKGVSIFRDTRSFTAFQDYPEHALQMNHPGIIDFTFYKPLLKLLKEGQDFLVPTLSFDVSNPHTPRQLILFAKKHSKEKIFLFKPADSLMSQGVSLISRSDLLNLDFTTIANSHLKFINEAGEQQVWCLQPFWPSDPFWDKSSNEWRNPVGRIFYHIIFDGKHLGIYPLTLYNKLSEFKFKNMDDIYNPNLARFGAISESRSFDLKTADRILKSGNKFIDTIAESLFLLVEHGLYGNSPLTNKLRRQFYHLSKVEQDALWMVTDGYSFIQSIHEEDTQTETHGAGWVNLIGASIDEIAMSRTTQPNAKNKKEHIRGKLEKFCHDFLDRLN